MKNLKTSSGSGNTPESKNFFKLLIEKIKNSLEESNQRYYAKQAVLQQQQQQYWQQQQFAYICGIATQLSDELYQALGGKYYPPLRVIHRPSDFGFLDAKVENCICKWSFKLQKERVFYILPKELSQIKNDMNHDIAVFVASLRFSLTDEEFFQQYPFLYHGVYIASVQNLDDYFVKIEVYTKWIP